MSAELKAFLDSNVVLYLLSADAGKADRAEELLRQHAVISVQVLNEVTRVCRGKLHMSWREIADFLGLVRLFCEVLPLTEAIHDHGRKLAERYRLGFYDAIIVAAAMAGGCTTLYTEDMHHGLMVDDNLAIRNPFHP